MKNSFSSSPSSNSISSSTLDAKTCSSKGVTAAGCLAGVFRAILCSGNLPTHPSDQVSYPSSKFCDESREIKNKENGGSSPGIVARLMGLDSMPEFNSVFPQSSPNSISRSRSMNSAEKMAFCDGMKDKHRRVRSTLSLREMPTFLELEDDKFFILSFENPEDGSELRPRERKCEVGFDEFKQRTEKNSENEENGKEVAGKGENGSKFSQDIHDNMKANSGAGNPLMPQNSYEQSNVKSEGVKKMKSEKINRSSDGVRTRNNKSKIKRAEHECSSEDSSPVSVLDFCQLITDAEVPRSEEDSRSVDLSARRKLSTELEDHDLHPLENESNSARDGHKTKTVELKYLPPRKIGCSNQKYSDNFDEVFLLTEADIIHSNWTCREFSKLDDSQGINSELGSKILDQLLGEVVEFLYLT